MEFHQMTNNNKLKQTWLVTSWEFMYFFKWKQELVSKLILIAIGLMVMLWQQVKGEFNTVYQIAVPSTVSLDPPLKNFNFVVTDKSLVTLKKEMAEQQTWDAIIVENSAENGTKSVEIYSQDKQSWQQDLQQQLMQYYTVTFAKNLGLEPQQLALLNEPAIINYLYLDKNIKSEDSPGSTTAIGMIILIAVGVFTSFGQLFVSITGEKQQRVTEQLYSSISPQTWIDGKIFGQILHSIKAMFTTAITSLLVFAFIAVIIEGDALSFSFIDWSLLPWLIVFAITGVYFCTAFMAAIAAAIDDPNHSAKTSIMLLPLVPIIITFLTMDSPSGWALTFLSFFPLTAFAAMPVKMSLIDVPLWHPLLSLALSIALCIIIRIMAARLFKMGMSMYGKEPSLKEMIRLALSSAK